MDLKNIVCGSASLTGVKSGGIAIYEITAKDSSMYVLEIDLSNREDVGEYATFEPYYPKALTLMRWIRRAIEEGTLLQIRKTR